MFGAQTNHMIKLAFSLGLTLLFMSCASLQKPIQGGAPQTKADSNMAIDDLKADEMPPSAAAASAADTRADTSKQTVKAEASKNSAVNFGVMAKANRLDQIKEEAIRILASNANDLMALNALAFTYFKKNKFGAARIVLERANDKNPNSPQILTNLAILDLADGEPGRALTHLKKSYKIDDHSPETLGLIGSIYIQNRDYAKALSPLEQSYRSDKTNVRIANNYAVALTKTKSFEQAQKIYDEILAQNSRESEILLNYAGLLIDYLNKPKEGLNLIYKVKFIETERQDILDLANKLEIRAKSALK